MDPEYAPHEITEIVAVQGPHRYTVKAISLRELLEAFSPGAALIVDESLFTKPEYAAFAETWVRTRNFTQAFIEALRTASRSAHKITVACPEKTVTVTVKRSLAGKLCYRSACFTSTTSLAVIGRATTR